MNGGADEPGGTADGTPIPAYDDAFLDRVAGRLGANYDLDRDVRIHGERFELYGELVIHSQKQFLHPSISFAHHDSTEHLFARRTGTVREADLDRLIELGHDLAEEWIDPSEEHYSTDFTFALVADDLGDAAGYVPGFSDRTLLKFGYNGHYEINLLAVEPEKERLVASENADVATAFSVWGPIETADGGLLDRIASRLPL